MGLTGGYPFRKRLRGKTVLQVGLRPHASEADPARTQQDKLRATMRSDLLLIQALTYLAEDREDWRRGWHYQLWRNDQGGAPRLTGRVIEASAVDHLNLKPSGPGTCSPS